LERHSKEDEWMRLYRIVSMLVLIAFLAVMTAPAGQAQSVLPTCSAYGTNKEYGGGWGTMAVIKRGDRAGKAGPYVLYEVLIRINYESRAAVDRSGLIVQGAAFARYGLFGNITGYGKGEWTGLRPSFGKPNPYYVHTTVTVRLGSTIRFAAAAANGPQLVYWGPIDSCLAT
jgi:hypothetical protein